MDTNAIDTLPQTTPRGGGEAFFEIIADNKGKLAVPQLLRVPELLDYDWQDKGEVKEYMGGGKRPIGLVGGKHALSISLTMAASFGKLLNQLCYGTGETANQHVICHDTVGYAVPGSVYTAYRIKPCVSIHFGRWDGGGPVKINGVATTGATGPGEYSVTGGKYTFDKADAGKAFEITYLSDSTSIVAKGKIPATGSFDVRRFSKSVWETHRGDGLMVQDKWDPPGDPPAPGHYQGSGNGVMVLNEAANLPSGARLTVVAVMDGVTVELAVSVLPDAGHRFYVDPPSAAAYVAAVSVELSTATGAAMTGVAVGGALVMVADPADMASGAYLHDGKGGYRFSGTDAGDIVKIHYTMDYYSVTPVPRDARGQVVDGAFHKLWGVRNALGKPLVRVALVSPLSIAMNQFALDENTGTCYFDNTNAGDVFYFDAEFTVAGGSRTEVYQEPIGATPIVRIALSSNEPDQQQLVTFDQAMCEGLGVKTKSDDAGEGYKFTFKCAVDRVTNRSHAVNMSS